ncbi:4-(cytidine 5'-diphospho)-2-C-methyl-D-erythritol kinase [Planktothrix agardhii 1029]|jgi:4-diphosphocytidyl-2-C-methyl-D-erythritol kinase|uniref:4-(cytidine 5'-diphospho)-2-C-methyl-D-erythritol kinase n=1 Tax=Planktothrix agardhii TaxID=1160 RepID=UPI001D0ADF83|nr:4-(cytidine 5'-diphospho)-2-C-methyl-D-erythritol kinase [Planktothrix agardhii]MCB8766400.1 4-(cytidine 5'-diphospho)-2-C-methyl-D-erythritol kinase [Planktothrix agardhii 1809]MCB8779959.1 4-(cytidine 5'-diphospho)-2-C-methyl-D-erythritol kinase [Planktothrix agardhii 1031]MCB8784385.1 4-(cytidine 5'-diphospho)-2-C-methyl-D-erythritol kinase [Planktothrix agardhii 1808]MCF3564593.1 4-(cytidine 5'-diphospho)-2-C-methyl-D-erythritol kinase [Planktothrix agardhii 1807]MCF3573773.1 4-(cytidin
MRSYSLIAPAKINLYLEIIGDRPDGYHELAMVLQSISLADQIDIRSIGIDAISVRCNHAEVPNDHTNLAYRAAALLTQEYPEAMAQFGGVEINIKKNIPIAAGLAGGSTDAAAVLVGLDLMWQLGLTQSELEVLGAQIGSDVPFCIQGGTALATGRGEELSPLKNLDNLYVVLAKYRNLGISTIWAYKTYRQQFSQTYISQAQDLETRQRRVHSGPMVSAIMHADGAAIGQLLHNDLEKVALPEHPQVLELREAFESQGVLGTMMSGSGPTVFALTASEAEALRVLEAVKTQIDNPELEFWTAKFVSTGIRLAQS